MFNNPPDKAIPEFHAKEGYMQSDALYIEKRRSPRLNQSLPLTLHLNGYPEQAALCKNISEGGAYIEIPDISVGEHISVLCNKHSKLWIKIYLENGLDQVEALAVARWTKPSPKDNRFGIGMEFIELPPSQKNRLSSYLREKLKPVPKKFVYTIRTYLADVNVFGTTYFSRYFDWQGKIREEFFLLIPGHEEVISSGIIMVTKTASIEYMESVRLFDDVIIEMTSRNIKNYSFEIIFKYYIKRLTDNPDTKGLAAIAKEKICFIKTSEITKKPEVVPVPECIRKSILLILDQPQE